MKPYVKYSRRKKDGRLWLEWSQLPERILIQDEEDPIQPIPSDVKKCMICYEGLNHTLLVHVSSLKSTPAIGRVKSK